MGRALQALIAPTMLLSAAGGALAQRASPTGENFTKRLLIEHNRAREDAGVPHLRWSPQLASQAAAWANVLAREGRMRHSTSAQRSRAGENLWMGVSGYYGAESMVGAFVAERMNFVRGEFPGVSRTGRWQDVGHYTQVVWRDTREVGCALARGQNYDFLVCRYWPAGNWLGQAPF